MPQNVTATSQQFTIQEPQSIVLNSPNSGSFSHASNISIQWTKNNFTENVDLYYTSNTTFATSNAIATNYNSHPFSWNVPASLSGSSIYIWVRKTGSGTVLDRSNNAITITGTTLTRTIAESLTLADTSSKGDEDWKHIRSIAESLVSSDTDSKTTRTWAFIRSIAEGMTTSDSWLGQSRLWKKFKTLAETLTSSDTDSKTDRSWKKFKTIAEGLSMSDSDSKTTRLWKKFKTIAEGVSTSDTSSKALRVWIQSRSLAEQLNTLAIDSDGYLRIIDEELSLTDNWTKSVQSSGTIYELDAGGTDESFQAIYRTGWIMPNNLSKNAIIRRVNLDYLSDSAITIKIFKDDDTNTPFATKILNASSTPTHGSIRLGTRIKYFLIAIETTQSANENVRIERIEIEVDN